MVKKKEENTKDLDSLSKKKPQTSAIKGNEKKTRKLKRKLKKKKHEKGNYSKEFFIQELEIATRGLNYISETDADIFPFIGEKAVRVDSNSLLVQIDAALDSPVEVRDFAGFFRQVTKIQDWFDEERIQAARNFQKLKEELSENLRDLKVINVGRIDIDVYVIGLDSESNLMGIKTKAIET